MLEEETNLAGNQVKRPGSCYSRISLYSRDLCYMLEEETNLAGNQVKRPGSCYSRISLYSRDLCYAGRRNQPGR